MQYIVNHQGEREAIVLRIEEFRALVLGEASGALMAEVEAVHRHDAIDQQLRRQIAAYNDLISSLGKAEEESKR